MAYSARAGQIRLAGNAVLMGGRKDFEVRDRVSVILCFDNLSPTGALLLQPAGSAQDQQ
jgi:hypothetical protein